MEEKIKSVKKTKKEIVKSLLNEKIGDKDLEELLDMLVDNPISVDVDKQVEANITFRDKMADRISEIVGSWGFILGFGGFMVLWVILNGYLLSNPIDPYPFILLNLLLSCVAAIQAPIIMMSQNRQAHKDSLRNQNDYKTDLKSELILEELHDKMDAILANQRKILKGMEDSKK